MLNTHNQRGITLMELIVVITIIITLTATFLYLGNPLFFRSKARDNKRLGDLRTLERLVTEYRVDHGAYPDSSGVLRSSMVLPSGRTSLTDPRSGWIIANLIEYNPKLPIDPINKTTYFYTYKHANDTFELNAKLEVLTDMMTGDHGNDPAQYEIGTDLTLITP